MFDGYVNSETQLEQFLSTAPTNPQALLLSAYMDEKRKWEGKLYTIRIYENTINEKLLELERMVIDKQRELDKAQSEDKEKSKKWFSIIFGIFGIKTKTEKRLHKIVDEIKILTKEIDDLYKEYNNTLNEYNKVYYNPPDAKQYELAIIGNTLFKPR